MPPRALEWRRQRRNAMPGQGDRRQGTRKRPVLDRDGMSSRWLRSTVSAPAGSLLNVREDAHNAVSVYISLTVFRTPAAVAAPTARRNWDQARRHENMAAKEDEDLGIAARPGGIAGSGGRPACCTTTGSWGQPRMVSDSKRRCTFSSRSRAASVLPARCLISACWKSPSKTAYAALEGTASGVPVRSANLLTMRQIMRSRLWSISSTSLRKDSSNRLWFRRSYQSRCIVASSRTVVAMAALNPRLSSPAEPAEVTMLSYRVTHSALYCRTQYVMSSNL